MNEGFKKSLLASEKDRADTFLAASQRLGANAQYVEKDFWVCWTIDVPYHGLPAGGPRLLFKGGTSLSKGYCLINRFSEDIDITAFREDLKQAASAEELEGLSGKKRKEKLDAIRDACQAWVQGPLRDGVSKRVAEFVAAAGRVDLDDTDPDGQTLLVFYFIEEHPEFLPLVEPLFREVHEGRKELVTSALTLLEVLVVPYRSGDHLLGDHLLAGRYEALLTQSVHVADISRDHLCAAAQLL